MAGKWVKALKPISRHTLEGAYRTYQAGDWFECNNQEMRTLLAQGRIEMAQQAIRRNLLEEGCAIVITGGSISQGRQFLSGYADVVYDGPPHFPVGSRYYLWWDTECPLRLDLMPVGFHRISAGWQMAAPLWRYNLLARDIGDEDARQRTKEVIRDLRVPVFDTHLIYVRRDAETERLLALWLQERASGDDDKLCFMRALYQVKPLLCALPQSWAANAGR